MVNKSLRSLEKARCVVFIVRTSVLHSYNTLQYSPTILSVSIPHFTVFRSYQFPMSTQLTQTGPLLMLTTFSLTISALTFPWGSP